MLQIYLNGKTRTNRCAILCNSFAHYKRRSGVDLVAMRRVKRSVGGHPKSPG